MSSSLRPLVYSSRPQRRWSEASRLLARCVPLLVTDERGRQLYELLRATTLPVWIEGARRDRLDRVLVAIDPYAPAHDMRRLLELGHLLGVVARAEVFALQAWDAPGEQLLRQHASAARARDYVARERGRAAMRFAAILRNAPEIDDAHRLCERGAPRRVIGRVARGDDVGAVVVGMSRRSRFAHALLGSTAVWLAGALSCHVLVLPPLDRALERATLPRAITMRRAA